MFDSFQMLLCSQETLLAAVREAEGGTKNHRRPESLSWLCHLFCVASTKSLILPKFLGLHLFDEDGMLLALLTSKGPSKDPNC